MSNQSDTEQLWRDFKSSFENFVVGDIQRALKGGVEVGAIMLTAAAIDCLGGVYAGAKSSPDHFNEFVRNFMPAQYKSLAKDLYWCVRCGLIHAFTLNDQPRPNPSPTGISTFRLTRDKGESHLEHLPKNPDIVTLNRQQFAEDFFSAKDSFFERAESDPSIMELALTRLNATGVLMVLIEENLPQQSTPDAGYLAGKSSSNQQSLSYPHYLSTGVKPRGGLSDSG